MFGRRVVAVIAAFAVAISISSVHVVSAVAVVPGTADQPTKDVDAGLTSLSSFIGQLATNGQFAKQIPTLNLIPGSADGFGIADMISATLAAAPLAGDLGGAEDLDEVASKLDSVSNVDLGDGRKVSIDASHQSAPGLDTIPIDFHLARAVTTGLAVETQTAPFAFTSTSGVDVTLTLDLHVDLAYVPGQGGAEGFVYLEHSDSTPSLSASVQSTALHQAQTKGAIGILGVLLNGTSSYSVVAHLKAAFADPNNDGKLAFKEPDGSGGFNPGELAGDGAPAGLVAVNYDTGQTNAADGQLDFEAQSSDLIDNLPTGSASVQLSAPNLTLPNPVTATYGAGALDTFSAFERLTPKDLADAIASLVQTLTTAQLTKSTAALTDNIDLPFMKGTLADMFQVSEALRAFLEKYVEQIPADPHSSSSKTIGKPRFSSIQELLGDLKDNPLGATLPAGTTFSLPDLASYNNTANQERISFSLRISRSAPSPIDLDPSAGPLSSSTGTGVTYGDKTLTDASGSTDFDPAVVVGRQVTADGFTAAVKSVSADHKTLNLDPAPLTPDGGSAPDSYWSGATSVNPHPADGAPYIITAADPQTGLVQLGDVLKDKSGLVKLNAEIPTAKVTPSYQVNLPVVFDLSPPTVTTPTTVVNPDGSSTVVAELPTPAQRVKIHTGGQLFWLDAPITAHFEAKATVGFLGANASGDIAMCTASFDNNAAPPSCSPVTGETHLLSLSLVANPPKADGNGDISLPDLFSSLGSSDPNVAPTPQAVFSGAVHGTVHGSLRLKVPGADTFFGTDHADITLAMADILHPTVVDVAGPDLSKLDNLSVFDIPNTDDPKALFGALLNALTVVDGLVQKVSGDSTISDALKANIPLLGTSVQQLIGGGISGGDGATYGDVVIDGKHHGTIADPNLASLTDAQLNNLVGREINAGTVSGEVAAVDTVNHMLVLDHEWQPQPTDGTSFTLADELVGGLGDLLTNSADSLQDMLNRLATKLGTNADGSSVATFSVDTSASPANLKLDINWRRGFEKTVPVQFKLGTYSLAGSDADGTISVGVDAGLHLKLVFPLSSTAIADPGGNLKIDPSSAISVKAHADAGNNVFVKANVGPLAIALGDPGHPNATNVEAHAKLGVGLTDSDDSDPVSVGDFLSHLKPQLNTGVDPVHCTNAPEVNTQSLAVCASLPIYTSPDGGTNWNLIGASVDASSVKVRVPQETGTNLGAQFDLTGQLADGTTDKVAVPANLLDLIASSFLDLSSLNDGLLGYLKFAQQSMQLASFNGQLPLVGKDLQQGADFLAKIRKALDDAGYATAGKGTTAGAYQDLLDKLGQKLDDEGILPGGFGGATFHVEISCTSKLAKVNPAPDVTTSGGGTGTHYQYEIVAVRTAGGTGDTVPSAASTAVENAAPAGLDGTHLNHLTWTASVYADHYKILRSDDSGGSFGNFELVDTVDGDTLAYDDHKTSSSAYAAAASEPQLTSVSCPDDAPGQDVDGISITTDLGTGNLDNPASACGSGCVTTRPLSIGMPGLSFKSGDSGVDGNDGVTAAVAWSLHLKFGLSRARGFYVATQDHGASDPANESGPEFKVGVALDLPSHMTAQLAFLNIDIAKHTGVTDPLFKGTFAIDLRDGTSAPDCSDDPCAVDANQFIDLAKIQNAGSLADFVTPLLSAEASIDWDLYANTAVGAALPGIGAEFKLHWKWTNKAPGDGLPDVLEFDNVTIDPGQFLGSVLGKVFKQIADVTKPIQPIIDTIQAEIPVLSDLSKAVGGDPVTIASLAQTFSTLAGGPEIQPFIDVVTKVINIAKSLSGDCGGGAQFCVNVGSFNLLPATAKNQENTPDLATSPDYITTTSASEGDDNPVKQLNAKTAADIEDTSGGTQGGDAHPGFSFPAIEHPAQIFQLLMGHDVTLAEFDSGPLTLGFSFSESFGPVYAPPPVNVVIQGSAGVTIRIVAGFDTYGIRKAVENKKLDVGILDSLFFKTTDDSGKPIPVVTFTGSIAAGAEVSAFVIKVGIVGGITLTVNFYWHDPDNDGKFRFSEFLATALSNPICLFDVGGELSLFIKVYITIGIDPFSVSFDFTLVNIKLLDFSLKPNCTPPPPQLGGVTGTTLYIYAGKLGTTAARGDSAWNSNNNAKEAWVVRENNENGGKTFTVTGLGITHTFTQDITKVVFDARGYQGDLQVLFQGGGKSPTGFDADAYVWGGDGNDTIKTGKGKSFVDGGPGDDSISTGDRPDPVNTDLADDEMAVVAGGYGKDTITTGNAKDWVAGDGNLTVGTPTAGTSAHGYDTTLADLSDNAQHGPDVDLSGLIDPSAVSHPATATEHLGANEDGADLITTGIGGGTIWAGGGNDKVGTSQASTILDANSSNPIKKARLTPQSNTIIAGSGSDNVASGSAADEIYTGGKQKPGPDGEGWDDGANTINTVDTGSGNDNVYGSTGEDDVTVHTKRTEHATIFGGGGKDILDGGDGADKIYGGPDSDYLIAQPAGVDKSTTHLDQLGTAAYAVNEIPEANPSTSDKTLVGGGGSDRIFGGDGTSTIFGDHDTYPKDPGAADFTPVADPCASPGPAASDPPVEHPNAGTDPADGSSDPDQADKADLILGGDGEDTVQAGGGGDFVYTFGSNDLVCGEGAADTIDLGSADDTAFAGSGKDHVFGQDGVDHVYGNGENDELYGQNGNDVLEGNDGTDTVSGGGDDDVVVGGTRWPGRLDEGDFLYGDNGLDTIVGDNVTFPSGVLHVEDLSTNGTSTLGGQDWIYGGNDADSLYGGLDADHVYGGNANDYIEGNSAGDMIFGEDGADNIIGGSAQMSGGTMPDSGDTISGGSTDDVILGDNGSITGASLDDVLADRGLTRDRHIALYDTGAPNATKFGDDVINGDQNTDAIFGEGGTDTIHGDSAGSTAAYDDYVEGGQGADNLFGDGGQDDIVGGSYNPEANGTGDADANDTISGGPDGDVILGDNGLLTRITGTASSLTKARFNTDGDLTALTLRSIAVYDQGDTPVAGTSGGDLITGNGGGDVILGQRGNDRIQGNGDSDYVEGDTGSDWIEGNSGADDLVGGATYTDGVPTGQGQLDSADIVFGGNGDDMLLGDNALTNRFDAQNPLTRRIDNAGAPIPARAFTLRDLDPGSARPVSGNDLLSGGGGTDVILGQDGDDQISGGANDDYAEGNGGHDTIWGDNLLDESLIAAAKTTAATGGAPNGLPAGAEDRQDVATPNGQDDLMGGSSIKGFRDTVDDIHGDGGADYELGDNGTIVRDVLDHSDTLLAADADLFAAAQPMTNRIYKKRYAPTLPLGAAYVRHSDPNLAPTTRFCAIGGTTCEPATAFGADNVWGDAGDDTLYGQDGNDLLYGDNGATGGASASDGDSMVLTVDSTNDDDMYGELGDDQMWGENGDDAMLGDRGGIVDQYETGNRDYTVDVNQVPKVHYEGFAAGTVTRQTDLQHDINGDAFVGTSTSTPKMPHPGDVEGGNDRIRGGTDEDFVHAGFGDDLANGDSGGDTLFGDDGADVMWGGKGCDASVDTLAVSPDCYPAGVFDPNARGTKDRKLDYLLGGKGAYTGPSTDANTGYFGSDILDWHPRGVYGTPDTPTTCSSKVGPETFGNGKKGNPVVTVDPCLWFEMTNLTDADVGNNQHHQGIDWQYGGWDRDVLQGDVADNGPNDGDRLLDWNGTYNLYTHCNSAYGGYNDVRQHSPDWQAFLQKWVYSLGAGQLATDSATGSVGVGTSAFDELALVYPGTDGPHGSGSAFPSTPGHFDNPNACAP